MKERRGFTLVELLAVIALIGVLLLLVTPNVIKLFTGAKKSLFYDEALSLYNNAYTTYIYNTSEGDYTKRFCRGKNTTTKLIDVEEKEGLYYDITVNSYGEVTSLKVSDDTFGLTVSNSNGIKKKSIKQSDVGDSFDINCNGGVTPPDPTPESLSCIITNSKRYCNVFGFTYSKSVQNI